ncbi:uncharacterized protein VTP21DRAFT_10688 [Calcarisporiella thermophila]|uniref:uncharacterized protein n=1 Tax=Calcarisporiella thermophila TaxID=911321 RepID=UPI00374495CA
MTALSNLFISKHRKADFELHLHIYELTNVPLVSGHYFAKWKVKSSGAQGVTKRTPLKDHTVRWNQKSQAIVQLIVGKDRMLTPCEFRLTIKQEMNSGREVETVGTIAVNISEYVNAGNVVRRYLLQESKFNSTIKLGFELKQVSGSTDYMVPQSKNSPLFSGITSIIAEQTRKDPDSISVKSRNVKSNNEFSLSHHPQAGTLISRFQHGNTTLDPSLFLSGSSMGPSPCDVVEEIFRGRPTSNIYLARRNSNASTNSAGAVSAL